MSEASKTPETVEQHLAKWAQQPGAFITDAERHFIEYMRAARMRGVGFGWMQQVIEWEWQTVSDAAFGPERLTEALDRAQRAEHLHYNSMQAVTKVMNEQSSKIAELEKDAARYQWLKANTIRVFHGTPSSFMHIANAEPSREGLDAAIDLASSGQGATEPSS